MFKKKTYGKMKQEGTQSLRLTKKKNYAFLIYFLLCDDEYGGIDTTIEM